MSNRSTASFQFGDGLPIIRNELTQSRIQWILLALVWLAFSMSYVSVTHCSFIKKGHPSTKYESLDQIGLFRVPYYSPEDEMLGCIRYDSRSEMSENFKFVRALAVLLLLSLSVISLLHTLSVLFLQNERRKLIIVWICRGLIFPTLLFNTLLFVIFGDDECGGDELKCPPGPGAILAIFTEIIVLSTAILFVLVPPPAHPFFVRYSSVSMELQGLPFRDGSTFSVPETVKAKNTIKKKVKDNIKPKTQRRVQKEPDHHQGALVAYKNGSGVNGYLGNHRDGSSSSTLFTGDCNDEEDTTISFAKKYRAPASPKASLLETKTGGIGA